MIKVFIWNFRGSNVAWGHASMQVDGGSPGGSVYISYWPGGNRDRTWYSDNSYCANPLPNRTFADDVAPEAEGGEGQQPDHVVTLDGLDETAIKSWWAGIAGDVNAQWCTFSSNCSTIVSKALDTGGGETYATWWSSHNSVWTPNDVLAYALAIQQGLADAQAGPPQDASLPGGVGNSSDGGF